MFAFPVHISECNYVSLFVRVVGQQLHQSISDNLTTTTSNKIRGVRLTRDASKPEGVQLSHRDLTG